MVGDERHKVWCGVGHVTPRDSQPLDAFGQDEWRMGPRTALRAEASGGTVQPAHRL